MRSAEKPRKMAADGDREMVLANFQSITGIENLDECITLLEHHDWDLTNCVNAVLGADDVDAPIRLPTPDVEVIGHSVPLHHPPRRVKFLVEWKEKTLTVILDDCETVGTIKRMLEIQADVPAEQQSLMGWAHGQTLTDESVLKDLNLREETALVLLTPTVTETPKQNMPCASSSTLNGETSSSGFGIPNSIEKRMLNIKYQSKEFNLPYPVTRTIGEVKTDVHSLTSIPCRNQWWSGWPDGTTDSSTLLEAKLSFPVHVLTVSRRDSHSNEGASKSTSIDVEMDHGSEDASDDDTNLHIIDDDEDDEMFADVPSRRQFAELLPQDSNDSSENLIKFAGNFEGRYGDCHPHFYMGPLSEAIKEANGKSARQRRPLLVYIHHDGSILTNVFCGQLLCSETIINYIHSNFVIWAWDVSHDTNKARLLDMITQHFGSIAASTVRGFPIEKFPLLLVVMKNRSALEVCSVLQGHLSLDELMTGLMSAHETFQQAMIQEIKDEDEREIRELMRREQDIAYEESLKQDRQKEEERRKKQDEEMLAKKIQEEKALLEAQLKEAQRLSLVDQLSEEPRPDCTAPISDLRFWLPNGQKLQRRFLASSQLQNVLTYVQTKGFLENEYKVVTNFPRRDLYTLDRTKSLQDHGIYPQEKIIVEER